MEKKGTISILSCYIFWGVLPVFWKQLSAVDSVYVLAARILWSFVFSLLVVHVRRCWADVKAVFGDRRVYLRLAIAGGVICLNWGLYIWSVSAGHLLDASLAYYMSPILTILLGTLVYRETLSRLQWLSVGVVLTGLLVTTIRYGEIPWLALVIGGTFSLYGAIKKKVHTDTAVSMMTETLFGAPVALIFLLWREHEGVGAVGILEGVQWLLLPAAGVVTVVPLMLYAKGIQHVPLSLSGILMYINPTLQLLISTFVYREAFTMTHGILFGFVWAGLLLYLLPDFLRSRRRQREETTCV